jgi:hypothetical protein
MDDGPEIKPVDKRERRVLTPKQLAANRLNAKKGGRPKGLLNKNRRELRDRIRARDGDIVSRLFFLLYKGESHAVQLSAARELLDRGYGRPVQLAAVGVGGEGQAIIQVVTGVPRRNDFLPSMPMPGSADTPSATRMH